MKKIIGTALIAAFLWTGAAVSVGAQSNQPRQLTEQEIKKVEETIISIQKAFVSILESYLRNVQLQVISVLQMKVNALKAQLAAQGKM